MQISQRTAMESVFPFRMSPSPQKSLPENEMEFSITLLPSSEKDCLMNDVQ